MKSEISKLFRFLRKRHFVLFYGLPIGLIIVIVILWGESVF